MTCSYRSLSVVLFSLLILWTGASWNAGLQADHLSSTPNETPGLTQWATARGDAGASGATEIEIPENLVVLWETKIAEAIETSPVSDGLRVYVADVMGGVEALNLADGVSIWRREFDTGFVASPSLYLPPSLNLRAEPKSVANAKTAEAKAIAAGDEKTSVDTESPSEGLNGSDAKLVIGDVEGNVYALNLENGETLWKQVTEGEINAPASFFQLNADSSPTNENSAQLGGNKSQPTNVQTRVLQTSQDGNLYCFDAADGKLVWKYETGDQIRCAASIGDGKTFLGGCDGGLHVVNLTSGKAAREPIALNGPTGSTPAIADGSVYVPIMDGVLYAFDLEKGTERWQYEDDDRPEDYRGSAAIGKNVVVVSSRNKHVDAIDRASGKRLWRTTLRRRADASPLITGNDVWVASTDGTLLRLSLDDGTERWSFEIKGGFFASPAIVNSRLIIADDEGVVRCFGKQNPTQQ